MPDDTFRVRKRDFVDVCKTEAELELLEKLIGNADQEEVTCLHQIMQRTIARCLFAKAVDDGEVETEKWISETSLVLGGDDPDLVRLAKRALILLDQHSDWQEFRDAVIQTITAKEAFKVIRKRGAEAAKYNDAPSETWRQDEIARIESADPILGIWVADVINSLPDEKTWQQTRDLIAQRYGKVQTLEDVMEHEDPVFDALRETLDNAKDNKNSNNAVSKRYLIEHKDFNYLPRHVRNEMPPSLKTLTNWNDRFARIQSLDQLAEAETLIERFPHCEIAIRGLLEGIEHHWRFGSDIIRFQPTILLGAPGVGKTKVAREFCKTLGVRHHGSSVGGARDANIFGVSAGWSTAIPSIVTYAVANSRLLNPAIILDELEKARDTKNGSIHSELLALLEPEEARQYRERYLATNVDASFINWLFTANSLEGIPSSLLSRCAVFEIPQPTVEQVPAIIKSMAADYAREHNLRPEFFQLDIGEIEAMCNAYSTNKSVRILGRLMKAYLNRKSKDMPSA